MLNNKRRLDLFLLNKTDEKTKSLKPRAAVKHNFSYSF